MKKEEAAKENYALLVEYDGGCFYGYQSQRQSPTVQEEIEKALAILLREPVRIYGAGRTDTGVHARGMIVNFRTKFPISEPSRFLLGINALTDRGLSIQGIRSVPESFHSQFACTAREYEYLLLNSRFPQPVWKNRAFWSQHRIDVSRLRQELELLKGEHDFRSLAKANSMRNRKSTVRVIYDASLKENREEPGLFRLRIKANGFLHNMIRILTGTLFEIAIGKRNETNLLEILSSKNRTIAGMTLPAYGLYFLRAYYDSFPQIDSLYEERDSFGGIPW
ncbi:tRNA pseudouridine(38-40) synthase TruA [Leptospira fletcheri]|uniref:tRNA pseudouridine synthase A n=1 Tax=Leptospira fletcheri TaxID=2484981 RepID=A0A4R9GKQ8_9LEPT|nr:tRNA pseudouridine(38-40) synthase TruA [Leptospira fletcheri]TGK13111.1 tRNA pseudouridine(38-40) synthase TruA [Leptospira fletcheri]